LPPADAGQTLTFSFRAVVVDGQARAIENLQASSFSLAACANIDPSQTECVRDPSNASFDAAYTVVSTGPDAFARIAGSAPAPYAAGLSFDSSGSISGNDPTDARAFAGKTFLGALGAGNTASLSVFAGGAGALIPTTPLTTFGTFTSNGASFFDELDQLAALEGGDTPLYAALDQYLQYTAQNAPSVPGLRKAVVVFTDGFDTFCAQPEVCRQASIDLSRSLGVDIYTVGLGDSVDTKTLSELAYRANGAYLVAANPEQLFAIYGSLGQLLAGSITTYETTWTIRASTAGVFQSGRSVFGVLNVAVAGGTLKLPFMYTIP
jgi:hypothetical protein